MLKNIMLSLVILLANAPYHAWGKERAITLLYTGNLSGQLEPCGCSPKTDFGGLARLSRFILENRKDLTPYVLIDAGNFSDRNSPQGRLKVEFILKAFQAMQFDAVAFLKNEKTFPTEFFVDLLLKMKVPYVSDAYPCKRSLTVRRNNIDIHISAESSDLQEDHLNILLTDLSLDESHLLTGWDIIITSSGETQEEIIQEEKTLIVSGYPRGKKLGILKVHVSNKGTVTTFSHTWQPLGNDWEDDRIVRKIISEYDTQVAELLRASRRQVSETTYVGVDRCGECHQPFVESWLQTKHAKAFSSLENVGKSADPECIICHAVGFGQEGGFFTIETTPELANVQCEECHGLNPSHIEDSSLPMKPVQESTCTKCHTEENSPDFHYPDYLEKIKHD